MFIKIYLPLLLIVKQRGFDKQIYCASGYYDKNQIHIYEFNETKIVNPKSSYLKDYDGYSVYDDYAGYDKLRKEKPNISL